MSKMVKMSEFEKIEQIAKNGTSLYDLKDQLRDYVYAASNKAFEKGDADRDAVADAAGIEKRREYIKECFTEAIGGFPEPSKDLSVKITETRRFDGYKVENIIYTPRDNVYVTANMYIPDNITGKTGAVIFVCGHWEKGKHAEEYQVVCRYLVKAGLIVFAHDPIGQGERVSYINTDPPVNWGVDEHDYAGFQCIAAGKSIARYFVHDTMRALDYLVSRPEVDPEKIGITGNSGGGTQSSLMMLADSGRLAAAAPATFIMNRKYYMKTGQAQDREQIWHGLTARGVDHEDIILSMAPKPVLILGVVHDFFPIEATEKTYRRCRRFWEIYGKRDCLERFYDDCDHHYTRKMAQKSAQFFAKHLLGTEVGEIDGTGIEAVDEKLLLCTPTGQVMTSIEGARAVYDEINAELPGLLGKRAGKTKEDAVNFLRGRIYKNRTAPDAYFLKRWLSETSAGELRAEGYLWMAQEDIINTALVFTNKEDAGKRLPATVAVWSGGTYNLAEHAEFITDTCNRRRAAIVLDLTGTGMTTQRALNGTDPLAFYGVMFKLNDDLLWLDDSLTALRTYDLLRFIDILERGDMFDADNIEVYSHGRYSVYADIAGFIDGRIKKVISRDPLTSYREFIKTKFYERSEISSVIMPGLLEYTDLDDMTES
ncbi:MAG: prolyl oligopeptidase family serine peptidase [Oscillospiraceae bacterium]|nr:prolyl oligopeptidase family serine peptidase [Oscillospiraceae bacterium]